MSREIIDREQVGRLMHESWSRTKRTQGFHGPADKCSLNPSGCHTAVCGLFHADLIPWDDLPEKQKDINRHAFDDVLPYFERLLADEREPMKCGHPKVCWVDEGDCLIRVDEGSPPLYGPSMRHPRKYCSVCTEREKVRERCAKQAESWNDTTDWMKARQRLPFRIAASIRQLDLTKLDEGGEEKR